jgi:hypothetical protein
VEAAGIAPAQRFRPSYNPWVTRTVLINRGRGKPTIHERNCSFITRRINNGLRLGDKYEEIAIDDVPPDASPCHWCAAPVDPTRQP